MKLRIRGNSVRLRVTRSELEELSVAGFTQDRVRFGAGAELAYRLGVSPQGPVRAEFSDAQVSVSVPREAFERWLDPSEVSIRAEQPIGAGERLAILVEKDFACRAPREGEDESDLFPNPAPGEG